MVVAESYDVEITDFAHSKTGSTGDQLYHTLFRIAAHVVKCLIVLTPEEWVRGNSKESESSGNEQLFNSSESQMILLNVFQYVKESY